MIITKDRIGPYGKTVRYTIRNSIADTGVTQADAVARFDSLELATVVLRYMRGDHLDERDECRAREALKKAAAPTDQSRGHRTAE